MSRPVKFSQEVIAHAQTQLLGASSIRAFRAAQATLLPALPGLTREQTALVTGLSGSRVGSLQVEARKLNGAAPEKKPHGGRRRELMPLEEEKAFLEVWAQKAQTAGMVIVPPLHQALEEKPGRRVGSSPVYRMLERHGWRKVAPDSIHPKADPERQENWKKNSRKWLPSSFPGRKPPEKRRV